MATGKATVVQPGNSSLSDQVRNATGNAVRAAQNAGASKKEVIQARDAAKDKVYAGAIKAINTGGSSGGLSAAQLQQEIYGGLNVQAAETNSKGIYVGIPKEVVQSRDHVLNLKNAGYIDAQGNQTGKSFLATYDLSYAEDAGSASANANKSQNPKSLTEAVTRYAESTEVGKKLIDKVNENKLAKKVTDDTVTRYSFSTKTGLVKEKIPKNSVTGDGYSPSEASILGSSIVAGFYGGETEYTKKIDRNSNVLTDFLDGVTSTLLDPSRLRDSHENPNVLAKHIPESGFGTAISLVDDFSKSDNIAARLVRGATLDNVAGITTLGSEAIKTGSAAFLDTESVKSPRDSINILLTGAGRLIGGTGAAIKDDPVASAGSFVAPGAVKIGGKVGKAKLTGVLTTLDKIDSPISKIEVDKVRNLEGDVFRERMVYPDNYPTFDATGKTIETPLKMFKETPNLYPDPAALGGDSVMIHAHPNSWGDLHYGRLGKHGDPGTFGGPNLSTKFLRMPEIKVGGIGFSNPVKEFAAIAKNTKNVLTGKRDLYSPSIDFIVHEGFERLPDEVRNSKKASREWMIKEADPSKAYLTHKLESNIDAGKRAVEPEAAITPGAEFTLIESKYKKTVKQPLTILGAEKIPGTDIKLQISVDVPIKSYRATGNLKTVKRKRATGIVETDKGVLLVKEKSGLLNLPGGGIEGVFETGSKAVARELFEETGIKSKGTRKLFTVTDGAKKRSNQGGLYYNEHLVYDISVDPNTRPNVKGNKEITGVAFWEPGTKLPKNINPASADILKRRYPETDADLLQPAKKSSEKSSTNSKKSKSKTKDISDFEYKELFDTGDSIPLIDATYAIKPRKTLKYSSTSYSGKTVPKLPNYLGSPMEYKQKSTPHSRSKTTAKTETSSQFLITQKRMTEKKKFTPDDVLGISRKKQSSKGKDVLKELRVNVVGDIIL